MPPFDVPTKKFTYPIDVYNVNYRKVLLLTLDSKSGKVPKSRSNIMQLITPLIPPPSKLKILVKRISFQIEIFFTNPYLYLPSSPSIGALRPFS